MTRKFGTTRMDYPKHWFVLGSFVWAVATFMLFYLATTSKEDGVRDMWLALGSVEGALLFLFFVPPLFTYHVAGERSIRLRMGLLMDATIPYSWIREVRETTVRWGAVRVGIGVRYTTITRALYVTSEFEGLVSIGLDGPHTLGRVLKRQVEQIVLSSSFRQKLVHHLRDKAHLEREG